MSTMDEDAVNKATDAETGVTDIDRLLIGSTLTDTEVNVLISSLQEVTKFMDIAPTLLVSILMHWDQRSLA